MLNCLIFVFLLSHFLDASCRCWVANLAISYDEIVNIMDGYESREVLPNFPKSESILLKAMYAVYLEYVIE